MIIKNGILIDPTQKLAEKGWLRLENAKITDIGKGEAPKSEEETLDAKGAFVSPGFIDLHVHLREPGEESKETIESGSRRRRRLFFHRLHAEY